MIKPILDGSRRRYQVAASEVAHQDSWQRAALAFAVVAPSQSHAEDVLDAVDRFVWSFPEVEVLSSQRVWADAE